MKSRVWIIIGIILASVVLVSSVYVVSVQNQCESLLGETHYPRPLTFWNCLDYFKMIDNPPPKSSPLDISTIPAPEPVIDEDGTITENTEPYTWYDITGLKQIYTLGEPISFTETVQGYGNPCVYPHYEILDGNTLESIWEYKIVYPCPFIPDPELFKRINTVPDKNVSSPILNQTGPYIFRSYHSYSEGFTAVAFSVVDQSFVMNTVDPCNTEYFLDANDYRKKTAPPISIDMYGRDATFLEPFSFDILSGKFLLPSYMPSCYELKSHKIKEDRRSVVYFPTNMEYDNDTTSTKIIQEGVLILVTDTSLTSEEWSASISKQIQESADVYSTELLKDYDVLLIHGIPSKNISSAVEMHVDGKQIQIISTKLDTQYLMNILQSMFGEKENEN